MQKVCEAPLSVLFGNWISAMTISNSNLLPQQLQSSALNTLQSKVAETSVGVKLAQGEQQFEQVQKTVSGFSTFLAFAQQATQTKTSSEKSTGESNYIAQMQQSLFGQLGMTQNSEQSFEQSVKALTSEQSIEKLQSAFLLHLQQNLFTPKTLSNAQNHQPETKVNDSQVKTEVAQNNTLKRIEQLSFGTNGLDLADGFDTVNILNHVPVVSELYKQVAGHDVSAISKLAGGYLYGGPTGLAFSALDLASNSLFDNSISGLLANADYSSLFNAVVGNEQQQNDVPVKINGEATPVQEEQKLGTVFWPNRAGKNDQ